MDPRRYLGLFVEEAREHLDSARRDVDALRRADAASTDVNSLFRHVHSLKGMAASMGFDATRDLAHAAEDLLDAIRRGDRVADDATLDLLDRTIEALDRLVEGAEAAGDEPSPVDGDRLVVALRSDDAPPTAGPVPARTGAWWVDLEVSASEPVPAVRAAIALGRLAEAGKVVRSEPPLARLRTGRFDGRLRVLLVSGSERGTIAALLERIEGIEHVEVVPAPPPESSAPGRTGTPESWVRVRADVLDGMLDTLLELLTLHARLARAHPGMERCGALLKRLYGDLTELRLVAFDSVAWRFERAVRTLEADLGKRVAVTLAGGDVRLDRSVLEALLDPLLHLVRNALDHGIEPPEQRVAAGKPPQGRLSVAVARDGDRLRISVEDDGRGLDPEGLRRAAVERGALAASEAARLSSEQLLHLATLPGVSTVSRPGRTSGRGVGLDVVVAEVERLGGRLSIRPADGGGTRCELELPLSVALVRALLVRASGELFAVPLQAVERTLRFETPRDGTGSLDLGDGRAAPVLSVRDRLGLPPAADVAGAFALVHGTAHGAVVFTVDEILGRRDVVVRPLGPPLDAVREYAGAALLENGEIVLVLDPWRLAEESRPLRC